MSITIFLSSKNELGLQFSTAEERGGFIKATGITPFHIAYGYVAFGVHNPLNFYFLKTTTEIGKNNYQTYSVHCPMVPGSTIDTPSKISDLLNQILYPDTPVNSHFSTLTLINELLGQAQAACNLLLTDQQYKEKINGYYVNWLKDNFAASSSLSNANRLLLLYAVLQENTNDLLREVLGGYVFFGRKYRDSPSTTTLLQNFLLQTYRLSPLLLNLLVNVFWERHATSNRSCEGMELLENKELSLFRFSNDKFMVPALDEWVKRYTHVRPQVQSLPTATDGLIAATALLSLNSGAQSPVANGIYTAYNFTHTPQGTSNISFHFQAETNSSDPRNFPQPGHSFAYYQEPPEKKKYR